MMKIEIFGKNIKYLREKKGKRQADLAGILELMPNTLGDYERNKTEPSFYTLIKISEFFELSIDSLLKTDIEKVQVIDNYEASKKTDKSTGFGTDSSTDDRSKSTVLNEDPAPYGNKNLEYIITAQKHTIDSVVYIVQKMHSLRQLRHF